MIRNLLNAGATVILALILIGCDKPQPVSRNDMPLKTGKGRGSMEAALQDPAYVEKKNESKTEANAGKENSKESKAEKEQKNEKREENKVNEKK
jgi:hypothetical protein